jgi:deferrochelatase/peroxidase EfeB
VPATEAPAPRLGLISGALLLVLLVAALDQTIVSTALEDKPADSHVASTDQDRFGKIFRRNMPYGTVTDHGTMFVGFSADQEALHAMLESMAGLTSGVRDALTKYTRPLTGAYYFVPAIESLRASAKVRTPASAIIASSLRDEGQRSWVH